MKRFLFRSITTKRSRHIEALDVKEAWEILASMVTDIDNWEYQGII